MTENSGVLDKRRSAESGKDRRLYSLVEVAQMTGIPMPILLRYKREHPDRVPSLGSGSQQRFPEEAFEVLRQIQQEESEEHELPRRGGFGLLSLPRLRRQVRPTEAEEAEATVSEAEEPMAEAEEAPAAPQRRAPRKQREAAAAPVAEGGDLLSLVEISNRVDIPYPTLARYASQYGDRIPHQGKGRSRRFPPEAIEVFEQIRKESKPGRPPKTKKQAAAPPPKAQAPAPRPVPKSAAEAAPAASSAPAAAPAAQPAGDERQLARRIASLEESQKLLEDQIRELIAALSKPATVSVPQV